MDGEVGPDALQELEAMRLVHNALKDLTPPARSRVMSWATSALEIAVSVPAAARAAPRTDAITDSGQDVSEREPEQSQCPTYTEFADLFGDAQPQRDADKALVGGYWLQVCQGQEDFASQSVNDLLKNTGEAVGNITRAFDALKGAKPQLVRQLQKSGKTQQARKKFKLTTAGIQAVERMLRGESA